MMTNLSSYYLSKHSLFTKIFFLFTILSYVQCQYSVKDCIKDPQVILDKELNVTDTAEERFYFLCSKTNFYIQTYNWDTKSYSPRSGFVRPLIFIHPNVHIICGSDGNINNNCTMLGGTLQLEVVDANYYGLPTQKITNISVRGVRFTDLGYRESYPDSANIYMFGTTEGASLLVQDCIFQNNKAIANIKFDDHYDSTVTVVGSIFQNNTLVNSTISRNSGLIYSDIGGSVFVNRSLFIDNNVNTTNTKSQWDGLHSVINTFDMTGLQDILSNINVVNSCFVRNKGISFSLVLGGIYGDSVVNSRNNYANNNLFLNQKYTGCGIGQLYMNVYYNYFGYYNLSSGLCQKEFVAPNCTYFSSALLNASTPTPKNESQTKTQAAERRINVPAAVVLTLLLVATAVAGFIFCKKRAKTRTRTPTRL